MKNKKILILLFIILSFSCIAKETNIQKEDNEFSYYNVYDPLEPLNKRIYYFNYQFDKYIFIPTTKIYNTITPLILRKGVNNFFHNTKDYKAPKGGEELAHICARTRDFWEDITTREELQDKNILIASHGCAVRALLQNVYEDADIANFWHGKVPPNCSVNIVEIKENKAILLEEDVVYYVR